MTAIVIDMLDHANDRAQVAHQASHRRHRIASWGRLLVIHRAIITGILIGACLTAGVLGARG
jgi:hypothetical protein